MFVHDESARIKWFEPLDVLQLEVKIPEKIKPKFQMRIKASSSCIMMLILI